jgi:predicted dehydrogenase
MNRRQFLSRTATVTIAGAGCFATPHRLLGGFDPENKVRVGFIGTAHPHAAGKLAAVRDLGKVFDLVGVVEPSPALRESCQSKPEYQNVTWLEEEQLFAADGLQAVIVETDFSELLPSAARSVTHGLHVHLDKPPGRSLEELGKLLADARRRDIHVQMGYMLRYNPAFELCFRVVREGWLGRIFELSTVMSTVRATSRRTDLGEPKGGAMFDLGSHIIDAVLTVLGPPHKVTPFGRRLYVDQDNVVDNQLAVLEYPDVLATVRATFVEPFAGERRQFVVCGEGGTLEIRPMEPPQVRLSLNKAVGDFKAGPQNVELPPMPGRYHAQLVDFANVALGNAKPRWSDEHDLAAQKTLLQACNLLEST